MKEAKHFPPGYLAPPKDLLQAGAAPFSKGECRFCNRKADVLMVSDGASSTPVILHEGAACAEFVEFFTKPGATLCADQRKGVYEQEGED